MIMRTITVKVDDDLKRMMDTVEINWSEYIREAIRRRIELEERRKSAEMLLSGLRARTRTIPKGFINRTIREMREGR